MDEAAARSRRTSAAMRSELIDITTDKALAARVKSFLELRQRAKAAAGVMTGAADLMRHAEAADRAAAADAVVAGQSAAALGTPHQDEARARVAAAEIEFQALSDALEAQWTELLPAFRGASLDEETAARAELSTARAEVDDALDNVMRALAAWRATAARVVYWHDVRGTGRFNYNPGAPLGLRGLFVDRANLDSSDVRREIQSVHDLLDPPVRRAKPDADEQHTAKVPARVR